MCERGNVESVMCERESVMCERGNVESVICEGGNMGVCCMWEDKVL